MYSYIIVRIIPTMFIPGTSLGASATATTLRVYNSIYMALCAEHLTCCIFGTATAAVTTAVVVTLTCRYSNAVRGHGTGSNNLYPSSSFQYARNIGRNACSRCTCLAFWRGECLYHRPLGVWLLDTVMVNI